MKNIHYNGYRGPRLSKDIQMDRVRQVIREELTTLEREVLTAYYLDGKNTVQIAEARGVHKSSVWRALRRAEEKLRKYLKY